ncbi:MAG: efflux RND transporter periplasmic adaptor subunit [bacterium]|nr:efflux RND transporter periplasmic adaptor subunit [bacterium]
MQHTFTKALARRKFLLIALVLLATGSGVWAYRRWRTPAAAARYLLGTVERGTLNVTVSGSGQVSAANLVEVKPKAAGDVVSVQVVAGQTVKSGAVIAQLDAGDALKAVRDAEASLASAELSLEKLRRPADALSLLQAEHALLTAENSKQQARDDLTKAYEDGFNVVADAFLDLPDLMTSLNNILYDNTLDGSQWNLDYYVNAIKAYDEKVFQYRDAADAAYQTARAAYDKNFSTYKAASRFSERAEIEALIDDTYVTVKGVAEAVKSAANLIQFYVDTLAERRARPQTLSTTHLNSLNAHTGTTNSHLLSLLSIRNSVQSEKEAITAAERTIVERTAQLADLKAGTDPLDLQTQELAVRQREVALQDAREQLPDYTLRAPIDGVVAEMNIKRGEAVSSGTVAVTLISPQQLAEITLNEVDVAAVRVGQKAILTFDAVEGLSLTGVVAEIDTLGAVSQGVVSYAVKVTFDAQDSRIKPGMSVSVNIITATKVDVLLAPNAAVKNQGSSNYVEMPAAQEAATIGSLTSVQLALPLRHQAVEVGLVNDESTEIVSGLEEGDRVITGSVPSAGTAQTQNASGGFRIPGLPTGGGGGSR